MEFLQLRTLLKYNISKYGILSFLDLDSQIKTLELEELDGLESIGAGVSTRVFKKDENTAICISIDIAKVSYLKREFRNKGFKFIKFFEYSLGDEVGFGMLYEMPLLTRISYGCKEDDSFLDYCSENHIDYQSEGHFDVECQGFIEDLGVELNFSSLDMVMRRYNAKTDIHEEQFMRTKEGKIVCIDPIISNYIAF